MHFYQTIEVYCADVYARKINDENKRQRTEMVGHKTKDEQNTMYRLFEVSIIAQSVKREKTTAKKKK